MTTLADIKREILRILSDDELSGSDPIAGEGISADLLVDAVHAALDAITTRVWKRSKTQITTDTTEVADRQYSLPSDVLDIEAVYDAGVGQFIPNLDMFVGGPFAAGVGNGWILFPTGSILFTADVVGNIDIYYAALWALPTDDNAELEVPRIAETAVVYFAASYIRIPDAASAASIRQYNTKVDSGQPTDNPVAEFSDFMLKRYEQELQRIPMMKKERR